MKNTVKISSIYFSNEIEGDYGKFVIVNINLVEKLPQFKMNEDGEKELVEVRQLSMREGDFDRLLVVNDYLAAIPKEVVEEEKKDSLTRNQRLEIEYKQHIDLLRGATITLEREEIKQDKVDDEGNVVKDSEGNTVRTLVGFGETTIKDVSLNKICQKKAEKILGLDD